MYMCVASAQHGSKKGFSESGSHRPFILGAVGGFGTRTAMMIKVLSERHLAVWTAFGLEAGRPSESEALAGTSGREEGPRTGRPPAGGPSGSGFQV